MDNFTTAILLIIFLSSYIIGNLITKWHIRRDKEELDNVILTIKEWYETRGT